MLSDIIFICDKSNKSRQRKPKRHVSSAICRKCGTHRNEVDEPIRTNVKTLRIGMITKFPFEYIHCICLGVMRRLLRLWTKGPLTCRLGRQTKDVISRALLSLCSFMPREFARKPRSLNDLDRWKATESKTFPSLYGAYSVVQ